MLEVKGVSRYFGGLVALEDVFLEVREGEIVGLMGPNGAGKTTLFNVITNLIPPSKGEVYFKREKITGLAPHEVARKGIVRTFQNVRVFEHLTVLENVEVAVPENNRTGFLQVMFPFFKLNSLNGFIEEKAYTYLKIVGLAHLARKNSSSLTFGQQRLLGIARALACEPEFLLFDEPSAGLNRQEISELLKVIENIHQRGTTIFIIEHNIGMLMSLAQRIIVLDRGKKILEGTPERIREEKKILDIYFGRREKCPV